MTVRTLVDDDKAMRYALRAGSRFRSSKRPFAQNAVLRLTLIREARRCAGRVICTPMISIGRDHCSDMMTHRRA